MAYKPVGVDEDSLFPPRVEERLTADYGGLTNLRVLHYDEDTETWPARPTSDPAVTYMWVGGVSEDPPPGLPDIDLWERLS